ncbi:MAG: flagellar hook-associated protein FlgL [Syntrophaceae bacterium]|nr:flagellar hook-associated protein FlgL [Syntrophaceae bacterium]
MRVSDNMKYYSAIRNMNGLQEGYTNLLEKLASQKRINRPSDDPVGMLKVLNGRQTLKAIEQYQSNIEQGTTWISVTETTLSSILDLFSTVQTAAGNYGTETTASRSILASQVREIRDQIHSLANSTLEGNYLFSGSVVGTEPFSDTPQIASTESGMGEKNVYTFTLAVNGTFQGTANKTYVVKMAEDGAVGSAAYQLSTDGGKTWGAPSSNWTGTGGDSILLDDNGTPLDDTDDLSLVLQSGQTVGQDDVFYVKAYAAGFYRGDGQPLSLAIGEGNNADYSSPGEGLFVPKADGTGVDVFQIMADLITAMEANDDVAVDALIDDLRSARDQLELGTSLCSAKQSRLEMAKNSLARLDQRVTDIIANTENADVAELGMLLSMKETALQSTYALAAKLGDNSILNFLR